jgi:hypothetical protein
VLAQDELLYQGVGDSTTGVDEKAGDDYSWPTIAIRIVGIREGGSDQIATHARKVDLVFAIVAAADEWG